jgi:hypothetical protein
VVRHQANVSFARRIEVVAVMCA